jgi:CMP-N,N'-diacetyllegionaminic acid synthase
LSLKYLAVIPARSGSKGIPQKNIRLINGKPMIAWSIEHALSAPEIERVIVSTDSQEIAEVAIQYGAEIPFLRPNHLSQDSSSTESVLLHALDWFNKENIIVDSLVLLQPTSPVRSRGSLSKAILQFEKDNADSLLSVCENHHFFWTDKMNPKPLYDFINRPRRQDILDKDRWYRENGSIYITKSSTLRENKNRLGGKVSMFQMMEEESWEIDSLADLKIASEFLAELNNDY